MLALPKTSTSILRSRQTASPAAVAIGKPRHGLHLLRRSAPEETPHASSSFEEDFPDESGNGSFASQNTGTAVTMPRSEQARRYFRTVRIISISSCQFCKEIELVDGDR